MAIQSLFGPSAAEIQEQRKRLAEQEIAASGGEFGVFAPLYQAGLRFGNQAVSGINTLMGVQDPMLKKATDIQSVLSKYQGQDLTSSGTLKNIAGDLAGLGYANESLMTAQEAQQAATRESALRKAATEERKALLSEAQELQLRQELNALGPNATEDQVLSVVTKYGTPDKILAALTSAQSRREQRDFQRSIQDQRLDFQRAIQEQRLDIQRQTLQFRRDIQDTKLAEKDEKKQAAAEGAIANAGRVIQTVGEAKQLVGPFTTGVGGYLSVLPSTDARKLKNKIETIKANLGFDRLQQMRDASPTGGALGQVAVREIDFLQATIATLDQLESASDITAALNKIEEHYSNWKTALEGKVPAKYQTGGGQAAVPTAPTAPTPVAAPVALPPGVTVKQVK